MMTISPFLTFQDVLRKDNYLFRRNHGVYRIINIKNGKQYVGLTEQTFARRMIDHNRTTQRNAYIDKSIALDPEAFRYQILFVATPVCDRSYLERLEIAMIEVFDTFPRGYNRTIGGDFAGGRAKYWSDQYRCSYGVLARRNGISYGAFKSRIERRKMTPEEAATIPLSRARARYFDQEAIDRRINDKGSCISKRGVMNRLYKGMSLEQACTTDNLVTRLKPFLSAAEANGISRSAFHSRLHKGMSPEEASTIPPKKKRRTKPSDEAEQFSVVAESNGISRSTFMKRLKYGWDFKKASTEPIIHTSR